MRWSIQLLILIAVAAFATLLLLKRPRSSPTSDSSGAKAPPISQTLLSRADATPDRTIRGKEFLKRVYSRGRLAEPTPPESASPEIGAILQSSEDDRTKAKRLLELALAHPIEANMEAVDHAVNLVTDADYDILRAALTNPHAPEAMLDTLLADILSRGNSLKLPTLVAVARQPDHPSAAEARDLLELHVGEGHGTNWVAWLEAAKTHIAERGE